MTRQINALPNPRLLIVAVAVVLSGIFGVTAVKAWAPGSADVKEGSAASVPENSPPQPEANSEANGPPGKCMECGIIESKREVWTDGDRAAEMTDVVELARPAHGKARDHDHMVRSFVVTVRMKDGARRQFVDATSANWRPGERVIVIRNRSDD